MNLQFSRDLPGPGDQLQPDNSVREMARDRIIEILTRVITDELMQNRVRIAEARGFFTTREHDAIEAAIMAGDAMAVGMLTIAACRRVIAIEAEAQAERRADAMDREDESDYAAERMEN